MYRKFDLNYAMLEEMREDDLHGGKLGNYLSRKMAEQTQDITSRLN